MWVGIERREQKMNLYPSSWNSHGGRHTPLTLNPEPVSVLDTAAWVPAHGPRSLGHLSLVISWSSLVICPCLSGLWAEKKLCKALTGGQGVTHHVALVPIPLATGTLTRGPHLFFRSDAHCPKNSQWRKMLPFQKRKKERKRKERNENQLLLKINSTALFRELGPRFCQSPRHEVRFLNPENANKLRPITMATEESVCQAGRTRVLKVQGSLLSHGPARVSAEKACKEEATDSCHEHSPQDSSVLPPSASSPVPLLPATGDEYDSDNKQLEACQRTIHPWSTVPSLINFLIKNCHAGMRYKGGRLGISHEIASLNPEVVENLCSYRCLWVFLVQR